MSGIIASIALPPLYEAIARSYNITKVLPKDLSFLENLQFDGKAVKIWLKSLPTFGTLRYCGDKAQYHFNHLRTNFPIAVSKYPESMKLASCFFGTSYLLERMFVQLPGVKHTNPYIRKAFAFLGGGAVTVLAAHHVLHIKADAFEVAETAARVSAIALGTSIALKTTKKALQILSITSKAAANSVDFLLFDPLERQMPEQGVIPPRAADQSNPASVIEDDSSDEEISAPTERRKTPPRKAKAAANGGSAVSGDEAE